MFCQLKYSWQKIQPEEGITFIKKPETKIAKNFSEIVFGWVPNYINDIHREKLQEQFNLRYCKNKIFAASDWVFC